MTNVAVCAPAGCGSARAANRKRNGKMITAPVRLTLQQTKGERANLRPSCFSAVCASPSTVYSGFFRRWSAEAGSSPVIYLVVLSIITFPDTIIGLQSVLLETSGGVTFGDAAFSFDSGLF